MIVMRIIVVKRPHLYLDWEQASMLDIHLHCSLWDRDPLFLPEAGDSALLLLTDELLLWLGG